MLNVHPIIELIHACNENGDAKTDQSLFDYVLHKYPDTDHAEIQYYLKKYDFIKACGFFGEVGIKQLLSGKVTTHVVEALLGEASFAASC